MMEEKERGSQAASAAALPQQGQRDPQASTDQGAKGAEHQRFTYLDCLRGAVPMPHDALGNAIFALLMAGGMVTFMVSFNGVRHGGLGFFLESHWLYPLVFCIAMGMRLLYANRVVGYVAPRYIFPQCSGARCNVTMTLLNVLLMAPVMCTVVNLLLKGPAGLLPALATELLPSMAVAVLVNLLVVGPAVKLLYHNVIKPSTSLRLCQLSQRFVTSWAGLFTS